MQQLFWNVVADEKPQFFLFGHMFDKNISKTKDLLVVMKEEKNWQLNFIY